MSVPAAGFEANLRGICCHAALNAVEAKVRAVAGVILVQQLCQRRAQCPAPNFISLLVRVEQIGHDFLREGSVSAEKICADIPKKDLLTVGETCDASIYLRNLFSQGVVRFAPWKNAKE